MKINYEKNFYPRNLDEALRDIDKLLRIYSLCEEGRFSEGKEIIQSICPELYKKSRRIAIQFGGLAYVKGTPKRLK